MGLMDKLKVATDTAKEKVAERSDKIGSGIDKAAGFVDKKTGGKYHDKIESATEKAKDAIPSDDKGQGGRAGGDTPAP
ncbi:MAG TPA: antitoxin [Nocardioides sp.]|nr:antitoxin [Nocardioides sp.]